MKTLIAVPSHDYMHADTCRCLMELDKPEDTGFALITNTLIFNARNMIAAEALKAGFDRVMWIDADMVFPADTLLRLAADMDTGKDFVTGLCFTRSEPSKPVIYKQLWWELQDNRVKTGCEYYTDYPKDSVFEIQGSGFACCMTSARLLADMVEKRGQPFWPLMGMGEDTTFCFNARNAGYKIWCDSRIKVGHIGEKVFDELEYWRAAYEMPV